MHHGRHNRRYGNHGGHRGYGRHGHGSHGYHGNRHLGYGGCLTFAAGVIAIAVVALLAILL